MDIEDIMNSIQLSNPHVCVTLMGGYDFATMGIIDEHTKMIWIPCDMKQKIWTVEMGKSSINMCHICTKNLPNYVFKPCFHFALCEDCYKVISPGMCPQCDKDIKEFIKGDWRIYD